MIRRLALAVLIGALLAPLGCKSMAPMATDSYYAEGIATGGMASPPGMAPAPEYAKAERELSESASRDREFSDEDTRNQPVESPVAPVAPDGSATKSPVQPSPDEPEPEQARQVIYTASLQLAVYELDEVIEFAEDVPERYGGWIQARQDYQITLRVPAARLAEVMAEVSSLGLVLAKTLQAADVTAEFTDLESRVAVLEKLQAQLELLLAQAKTVEDSLKVRQELERVRIELEAAKTRLRQLTEMVGFSTLTLNLIQRGSDEVLPTSNDPFPWVDELGVESTEYRG